MAEYIERKKALDAISEWLMKALHPENMSSYNEGERAAYRTALSEIVSLPAADVRPVVLCRDCKHYELDNGWCEYFNVDRVFGDYCSEGVKREES